MSTLTALKAVFLSFSRRTWGQHIQTDNYLLLSRYFQFAIHIRFMIPFDIPYSRGVQIRFMILFDIPYSRGVQIPFAKSPW